MHNYRPLPLQDSTQRLAWLGPPVVPYIRPHINRIPRTSQYAAVFSDTPRTKSFSHDCNDGWTRFHHSMSSRQKFPNFRSRDPVTYAVCGRGATCDVCCICSVGLATEHSGRPEHTDQSVQSALENGVWRAPCRPVVMGPTAPTIAVDTRQCRL